MLFISPSVILDRPDPLPPRLETILPLLVATTSTLLALALVAFGLRIWIRMRKPGLLGWDDATISLAMVLAIICWALSIAINAATGGRHIYYTDLAALATVARVSYVLLLLWLWAVTIVKVSVCFMLLRVKSQSKTWFVGLWVLIGVLLALAVAITICYLVMCHPIEANWKFEYLLKPGHCWSLQQFLNFTYAFSAVFVFTDFLCALLPIAFIYRIKRPLREKITLSVLMGLGVLASICGIMKMVTLKPTLLSSDPIYNAAPAQIWALAEVFIGIFAACIPSLRSLLENAFEKLTGRLLSNRGSRRERQEYVDHEDYHFGRGVQLKDQGETSYHSAVKSIQRSNDDVEVLVLDNLLEDGLMDGSRPESSRACYVTTEYDVSWEQRLA